jgi:hypothetical protein
MKIALLIDPGYRPTGPEAHIDSFNPQCLENTFPVERVRPIS